MLKDSAVSEIVKAMRATRAGSTLFVMKEKLIETPLLLDAA